MNRLGLIYMNINIRALFKSPKHEIRSDLSWPSLKYGRTKKWYNSATAWNYGIRISVPLTSRCQLHQCQLHQQNQIWSISSAIRRTITHLSYYHKRAHLLPYINELGFRRISTSRHFPSMAPILEPVDRDCSTCWKGAINGGHFQIKVHRCCVLELESDSCVVTSPSAC